MLKVSYREPEQELQQQILVEAPPVVSEAVALLWILQSMESRGDAVNLTGLPIWQRYESRSLQ
jgi:hypothetical protein